MEPALLLMAGAFAQTFLMDTIKDKHILVFVAFQFTIYIALGGLVGYAGTPTEEFLGLGARPAVMPGWQGWWYNPEMEGKWFKIGFDENPWYIHAGNVFYGISNAVAVYSVYQSMVVKEKVSFGSIHARIACWAFCSGAIGHISQYLGFPALGLQEMPMSMRVFVYFQGMVTSYYPVNWICFNRCRQEGVSFIAKIVIAFAAIVQTLFFTVHESGFFESVSIGPNDMLMKNTQGYWHFEHSIMHAGYFVAALTCYLTMPKEAKRD